ncbi:MAG: glycosyltransferase family 87 protein [Candidatus Bathyarchaeia archaeon]
MSAQNWIYNVRISDFHALYMAGKSWLSGSNPYVNLQAHTNFAYPPASLPFFGMFTIFDFNLATQLWVFTYVSLFAVALLALALTLKGERRYLYVSIAVLLFLVSFPLQMLLELGQIDLLVANLTIMSLVVERLKRHSVSAVFLSIATLLKGPAVFLLIYFVIFRRDLKYLVHFTFSTFVIVGASLLVVPIKLYWFYLVNVLPTLYSEYSLGESQSIVRVLYLAGLNEPTLQAISVAGFVLLAIFAFCANSNRWAKVFGKRTLRADAMFLMNVLIVLLLSPRSLISPYVWVILPLALFLINLLMDHVKIQYFTWVCLTAVLMNSALSPNFLYYRTLPLALIGNLMLTMSLILIYVHPTTIFRIVRR